MNKLFLSIIIVFGIVNVGTFHAMEGKISKIHSAALRGDVELLTYLIEHKYPVNIRNLAGNTPLHLAVRGDHCKIIKLLLAAKAQPNFANYLGATPFHYACERNYPGVVDTLLHAGADKYALDNDGNSPLMYAVRGGHTDLCVQLQKRTCHSTLFDNERNNPLHVAAKYGNPDTCEALIELGWRTCDPNKRGQLPLHLAASNGKIHAALILIENGSPLDTEDSYHNTPIMLALKHSHFFMARELLERTKDLPLSSVTLSFIKEKSLILISQQFIFHEPLIKHLRARGADVKSKDGNGFTALHYAAAKRHYGYTRYLIAIKANKHATDPDQITPFMIAINNGARNLIMPFLTVPHTIPPILMTILLIHKFRKDSFVGAMNKDVLREYVLPYLLQDCVQWQLNEARNTLKTTLYHLIEKKPPISTYQMYTPTDYAALKEKDTTIVTILDPAKVHQLRPEIEMNMRFLMKGILKSTKFKPS